MESHDAEFSEAGRGFVPAPKSVELTQAGTAREAELFAERNRLARELADLRDEFDDHRTRSIEDRAAESVAAGDLATRVEEIAKVMLPYVACGPYAVQLAEAVHAYTAELTRIEGL